MLQKTLGKHTLKLPILFTQTIIATYGTKGAQWLASIDSILAMLQERFSLRNLQLMNGLSYHLVLKAESDQYGSCVLKIPVEPSSTQKEANALRFYNGKSSVHLLDQDFSTGALLLELLEPGSSLVGLFPQQDELATEIVASVVAQLSTTDAHLEGFPTIREWFAPLETDTYPELASEYGRVRGVLRELMSIKGQAQLCHADLHHSNVLLSQRGWVSIDPKGVIAPFWFDVGCFMRNPLDLLKASHPLVIIERRIDQFSALLSVEKDLLRACSYAQAVLAASWARDDQADWYHFLMCASLLRVPELFLI